MRYALNLLGWASTDGHAIMALSNKGMQTFSYMMLISLAAGTCGGLGFLLYTQRTGQFSAPHPQRAPAQASR